MEIRTERLLLRHPRLSDVAGMYAIMSDPRAMAYWSTLPHASLAQTELWVRKMVVEAESGPYYDFIIERDGAVIGSAGYWRPPEIGFILHPDHWRQGLTREAVAPLIKLGFETLDLEEITADVDPRNTASLALLGGFGFRQTRFAARTFEIGGVWADSIYLSLKRSDANA
ncbi:MAG: GNAT family N-acetyltransferase [Caulobacter sp.]|nr:GNAT family N-acetyltransferase [Caulobacter sp.]